MDNNFKDLTAEIKALNTSYNTFKSKFLFSRAFRIKGKMAEIFGRKIEDEVEYNQPITKEDYEQYKKQLEAEIKQKYLQPKIEVLPQLETKVESTENNSTYVAKYPDQEATLLEGYCDQIGSARRLWDNINAGKDGQLLIAPTGSGKTYINGSVIKNFIMQNKPKEFGSIAPIPVFYVCPATVVDQTSKALGREFNLKLGKDVKVLNYEFLRSGIGSLYVKDITEIIMGRPHIRYEWTPFMHPILIVWDEWQRLTREESIQTKIALAFNHIAEQTKREIGKDIRVIQIGSSASPFSRVSEAKHIVCASGITFDRGLQSNIKVTEETWPAFAKEVAFPYDPEEYAVPAVENLMNRLEPFIVRIKAVESTYKANNKVSGISFKTKEEKELYDKAWQHYEEQKRKIEGNDSLSSSQSVMAILAQFTVFRKTAEKIRAPYLAEFIVDTWNSGRAPAVACAFKGTITAIYMELVNKYGWTREDVSFIWGGSSEALSVKQKIAKKVKESGLQKDIEKLGISMEDLGIDINNIKEKSDIQYQFEKEHSLLAQKPEDREEERMRFQRQDSKCLLFSFKAGGTGLSAHHEAKYPRARQREGRFTLVYSEKELIQALGRLNRITSISDTTQTIDYFKGTIEEHVKDRVVMKLQTMCSVVKSNESWMEVITGCGFDLSFMEGDEAA